VWISNIFLSTTIDEFRIVCLPVASTLRVKLVIELPETNRDEFHDQDATGASILIVTRIHIKLVMMFSEKLMREQLPISALFEIQRMLKESGASTRFRSIKRPDSFVSVDPMRLQNVNDNPSR
jgi:hypothetical protein